METAQGEKTEGATTQVNVFLDGGKRPSLFKLKNYSREHSSGILIQDKDSDWSLELQFRNSPSAIAFRDRLNKVIDSLMAKEVTNA